MRKILIFTALALAAGATFAQAPGRDAGEREARMAEWRAKADARFQEADTDRDGQLDRIEVQALGPRLAEHFDKLDANADGELSRDEMAKARAALGRHGRQGMQRHRAYMAGLIKGMDDDGNGAISRAELGDKAPKLAENFAAIDADGNGEMSQEEMKAFRKARWEERREQRASRQGE